MYELGVHCKPGEKYILVHFQFETKVSHKINSNFYFCESFRKITVTIHIVLDFVGTSAK